MRRDCTTPFPQKCGLSRARNDLLDIDRDSIVASRASAPHTPVVPQALIHRLLCCAVSIHPRKGRMSQTRSTPSARTILNKVPEVTVWFWVIKVLCTTVGESFADWIN